jgi:hypothetical protein
MAIYRSISMTFWTDSKIAEDFTPEDKYFYLYLMTNPLTNLPGCYEISIRQMSIDTGYTKETIQKLLNRMVEVHNVVRYSPETREILLLNWGKYNWNNSPKLRKCVEEQIKYIKNTDFKTYVESLFFGKDIVSIPYTYGSDTSVSVSVSVSDSVSVSEKQKKPKKVKHKYGEYGHVALTDEEYSRLVSDYGEPAVKGGITKVDKYCQKSGKTYKDYNLVLRDWGIEAPKIQKPKEVVVDPDEEARQKAWEEGFHDA